MIGDEDNGSSSSGSSSSSSSNTSSYNLTQSSYSSESVSNSSYISQISTLNASTSSQTADSNSISSTPNSTSQVVSSVNNSSKPASSTITSFLDKLFNFGSIQASAGEFDYSWPWKKGETWSLDILGWHQPQDYEGDGSAGPALDVIVPNSYKNSNGTFNSIDVLAPISGSVQRACHGTDNSSIAIGDLRILHMNPNWNNLQNNTYYTKSQKISTVALGQNQNGVINSPCGYGNYPHLHIKFLKNNTNIDGNTIAWYGSYPNFTSINSLHPTPLQPLQRND